SGHSTHYAAFASIGGNIDINDSVMIHGYNTPGNVVTVTAGGYIRFGHDLIHYLDGNENADTTYESGHDGFDAATPDILQLKASGDITITGKVGDSDPLEGLTIAGTGYPAAANGTIITLTDGAGVASISISATAGNVTLAVINDPSTISGDIGYDRTINLFGITLGADGTDYTITIDGTSFTYKSISGSNTITAIAAGLASVINTINTPDDVTFNESVVVAGDLNITASSNVTFSKSVDVAGDVTITASGDVTFDGGVTLTNGGSLNIYGATTVTFKHLSLSDQHAGAYGNIFIEGNEINFGGGTESVSGHGTITLRPSSVFQNIEIGVPSPSTTLDTLNLDNSDVAALAKGFDSIAIGYVDTDTHALSGTGSVRIGTLTAMEPLLKDNVAIYGSSITVEDYSLPNYSLLVSGTLTLDAVINITINNKVEAYSGSALQAIVLYSELGAITMTDVMGDTTSNEPVRGANVNIRAKDGITLCVESTSLTAVNTTNGDISIKETAGGGDFAITSVEQHGSGAITLTADAGSITVKNAVSGIRTDGSGDITLTATATGKTITVEEAIASTSGAITLTADSTLSNTARGTISVSGASVIKLSSNAANIAQGGNISTVNGEVKWIASTGITMTDGTTTNAGVSHGTVIYTTTNGNIVVSQILAGGTTGGAINLTATAGAITDGLTGDTVNLLGDTATATLIAGAGIGTDNLALQMQVAALAATVTNSGGLYVRERTSLTTNAITIAGSAGGDVKIVTDNGGIIVAGAFSNTATSGNILLSTTETPAEGTTTGDTANANINIQAEIKTASGNISVIADDDVLMNANGRLWTQATGKTIDVQADAAITMAANSRVITTDGNIRLKAGYVTTASGTMTLGQITTKGSGVTPAGTGDVTLIATAAITDADLSTDPQTTNIAARNLRISATVIGAGDNALETNVGTLAAEGINGGMFIAQSSTALTIGSVAAISVNRIGGFTVGNSPVADTTPVTLTGLTVSSGSAVVLTTAGNLTIDNAISALGAGNVLINVGGISKTLAVNAALNGGSGNVSVVSSGNQTYAAAGDITTTNGTIDVQATGGASTIGMNPDTVFQTHGKNIRISAGANVTLGVLDARTDADRGEVTVADDKLVDQADTISGWGSVSITSTAGSIFDNDNDALVNVYANMLKLGASAFGRVVASTPQHIETEVAKLSANIGSGGLFISEATAITVDQTAAVTVQHVGTDGTTTDTTDAVQNNLASAGALVLQTVTTTVDGSITTDETNGAISASGNMLLKAAGNSSDIILNATVTNSGACVATINAAHVSDTGYDRTINLSSLSVENLMTYAVMIAGTAVPYMSDSDASLAEIIAGLTTAIEAHLLYAATLSGETITITSGAGTSELSVTHVSNISMNAGHNLQQNADIKALGHAGTIELIASAAITQAQEFSLSTNNGDVALSATSGSITFEKVDAGTTGDVRLNAGTSIVDGDDVDANNTDVDIIAGALILTAGTGVGSGANHIETTVTTVSGSAGSGGLFVTDTDSNGLSVDSVTVAVNSIGITGATTGSTTDVTVIGVSSSSSGSLVLVASGDLTVSNVVSANGSGNILVQTLSATGDITANADIVTTATSGSSGSGTGNISVLSGHSVTFTTDADIRTEGTNSAGTIDVVAANSGSVIMSSNSVFGSTNGAIRVLAANSIEVGVIRTAATATANDG
ncbi:MAG: hypothetical protein JZU70_01545, partial [Chlorobium sp.]|nr:hypothetical protein [Chlorobium sp.]